MKPITRDNSSLAFYVMLPLLFLAFLFLNKVFLRRKATEKIEAKKMSAHSLKKIKKDDPFDATKRTTFCPYAAGSNLFFQ